VIDALRETGESMLAYVKIREPEQLFGVGTRTYSIGFTFADRGSVFGSFGLLMESDGFGNGVKGVRDELPSLDSCVASREDSEVGFWGGDCYGRSDSEERGED
jgi:hypothetical protein